MTDSTPPPGADRGLLLGVLALQLDFLGSTDLHNFLKEWSEDRSRPFAQLLVERGALASRRRALLEDVVREYLVQFDMDVGNALAAACAARTLPVNVEALVVPGLRNELPTLPGAPGTRGGGSAVAEDTCPAAVGTSTSSGQRFRILRPHAHGALGVVYLAVDEELNREVALKEIQDPYHRSRISRERFVLEAEVTGSLEHPGIVPVYGLGHYPDGRPYYAMRFIKGESLDEAIARFHQADAPRRDPGERAFELRGLLRRFVDVCNALAYAHSRNVIHRDVKPSNVMLGPYGETLVVDWGLAKVLDRPSPNDSSEIPMKPASSTANSTMFGQAVGTPAFMPPEQAAGRLADVGPASDVYSLGATLYHLLAGVPPFPGFDANAVIKQVLTRNFLPPRQVKHQVPRPLEAVILKAMAEMPEDRYDSAADLANDVDRWLADEPVSAYPEPAWERAQRWSRRHRTLVSGFMVLLLTALVGAGVGLYFVSKAREKAERNLAVAQKAVDQCFSVAVDDSRLQTDRTQGVRKLLLQKALPFYEGFESERPNDRAIQEELGRNHFRVAFITDEIGRKQDALASYHKARHVFSMLAERYPADEKYRSDLARICNNMGILQDEAGHHEEARASYEQARQLREQLAAGDDPKKRADLAETLHNLGHLFTQTGQPDEARKAYHGAIEIQKALVEANQGEATYRVGLAASYNNLGMLLREQKDVKGALAAYQQALGLRDTLASGEKHSGRRRADLADTHNNLGVLYSDERRPGDARIAYEKARVLFTDLAEDFDEIAEYRSGLASTLMNLGQLEQAQSKAEKAMGLFREAETIQRQLVDSNQEVVRYKMDLAATRLKMGDLSREQDHYKDAVASYKSALDVLNSAGASEADKARTRGLACEVYQGRARSLHHLKRHREAVADWDAALAREENDKNKQELRIGRATSLALAGEYREPMSEVMDLQKDKSCSGDRFYTLACVASLSSAAARKDGDAGSADAHAVTAVGLLRRAWQAKAFEDPRMVTQLGTDTDLDAIRERDDFKQLKKMVEEKPEGE